MKTKLQEIHNRSHQHSFTIKNFKNPSLARRMLFGSPCSLASPTLTFLFMGRRGKEGFR